MAGRKATSLYSLWSRRSDSAVHHQRVQEKLTHHLPTRSPRQHHSAAVPRPAARSSPLAPPFIWAARAAQLPPLAGELRPHGRVVPAALRVGPEHPDVQAAAHTGLDVHEEEIFAGAAELALGWRGLAHGVHPLAWPVRKNEGRRSPGGLCLNRAYLERSFTASATLRPSGILAPGLMATSAFQASIAPGLSPRS